MNGALYFLAVKRKLSVVVKGCFSLNKIRSNSKANLKAHSLYQLNNVH